jgi:hypothetical protein
VTTVRGPGRRGTTATRPPGRAGRPSYRRDSQGDAADPALVKVAGDDAVRAALFPDSTDAEVAAVIYRVVRLAMQEAFKFGGRWWGPPPSVQAFLTGNGQQEA